MSIDPNVKLHIIKEHETISKENDKKFSHKWVENAVRWFLYAMGGGMVALLVKALSGLV